MEIIIGVQVEVVGQAGLSPDCQAGLKTWQSGDSSNASKFTLNNSYYLTDEKCLGGNEEFPKPDGNGIERGHIGDGYAKITPL